MRSFALNSYFGHSTIHVIALGSLKLISVNVSVMCASIQVKLMFYGVCLFYFLARTIVNMVI